MFHWFGKLQNECCTTAAVIASQACSCFLARLPAEDSAIFNQPLRAQIARRVFWCPFLSRGTMPTSKLQTFLEESRFSPMKLGQSQKTLLTEIRLNGVVMPKHQFVEVLLSDGLAIHTEEEDKIQPMSRMAYFRATNEEQRAHETRIKVAGKKTVRYIGGYEVGAFEHAYALFLSAHQVQA